MGDYNEMVRKLAQARQMVEIAETETDWTKKMIAESELGVKLAEEQEILRLAKADEAAARAELSQAVLDAYDGDKRPHPAITVKDYTRYSYDPKQARTWAMEHMHTCVVLDTRKFEQGIAATDIPDFVTVETEHRVTVASDLSPYVI
jgi:hypothetical protein